MHFKSKSFQTEKCFNNSHESEYVHFSIPYTRRLKFAAHDPVQPQSQSQVTQNNTYPSLQFKYAGLPIFMPHKHVAYARSSEYRPPITPFTCGVTQTHSRERGDTGILSVLGVYVLPLRL